MALVGLTKAATVKYESQYDPQRGNEGATVFQLGTLDCFVAAYLQDNMAEFTPDLSDASGVRTVTKINQSRIDVVRFGLKGWENFKDQDGNDIAFRTVKKSLMGREYQVVPDELLAMLDPKVVTELAIKIRRANTVSEEEEKNFAEA